MRQCAYEVNRGNININIALYVTYPYILYFDPAWIIAGVALDVYHVCSYSIQVLHLCPINKMCDYEP